MPPCHGGEEGSIPSRTARSPLMMHHYGTKIGSASAIIGLCTILPPNRRSAQLVTLGILQKLQFGVIAQLAEHFPCTEEDVGSNPIGSTRQPMVILFTRESLETQVKTDILNSIWQPLVILGDTLIG